MRSVFIVVYDDGNVGDTLFMLYLYNVYVMMHFNLIFVFFIPNLISDSAYIYIFFLYNYSVKCIEREREGGDFISKVIMTSLLLLLLLLLLLCIIMIT